MPFHLGDTFPDFTAQAYNVTGPLNLYEYIEGSWAILFSHPADFTPVCTTELGRVAAMEAEFKKRGCKLIAFSCSPMEAHASWSKDIQVYNNLENPPSYPIIADPERNLAATLGIMDPTAKDKQGLAVTCRSVFYIGPDKKLKASVLYPATTGRSMVELLRVLDSLQLSAAHPIATPEGWTPEDSCMVVTGLTDEEANQKFPLGVTKHQVPSGGNYLRTTPTPAIS